MIKYCMYKAISYFLNYNIKSVAEPSLGYFLNHEVMFRQREELLQGSMGRGLLMIAHSLLR
jgi:hypothetical protein